MRYAKALSLCSAFVVTVSTVGLGSPASGKGGPILVPTPPDDVVSRRVSYADLNLADARGQRALMVRVKYAVNDLCFQLTGGVTGTFMLNTTDARCTRASWDQARPQIDLAVERAREIAATGKSSIAAAAITIAAPVER